MTNNVGLIIMKRLLFGVPEISTASRTALGPSQPPIQWVPGVLSLGVKWTGLEADHSPPSSAEVKERVELYLHSPSWRGAHLKKKAHERLYLLPLPEISLPHWFKYNSGT
jgi:hypothetical protein